MRTRKILVFLFCSLAAILSTLAAQEILDAVKAGDLAKVKALVEKDPKIVNEKNRSGGTILFAAISYRQLEIADCLISKGADVNVQNNVHATPFHLAKRVHRIAYPWGMRNNVVVFSGPDGILLVDTGFSKHAVDALRQKIAGLAKRSRPGPDS